MTRTEDAAGFLSATDVPAAVRAAVAAFEPPRGWEELPMPTKNSAQRSLIYFYGRRVRRQRADGPDGARLESKWFCLASAQCRASATTISTTANISGCTRHLQVFHGLVSPKTAQMAKKAAPTAARQTNAARIETRPIAVVTSAPSATASRSQDDAQESTAQLDRDGGDAQRVERLKWTRVMIIRHLFPLAPLVNDEQIACLMAPSILTHNATGKCELTEDAVLHHLVECYSATFNYLQGLIRRELARTALPILHVGLLSASAPGSSCGRTGNTTTALTLLASFVSSTFRLHQFVIGVAHVSGIHSQPVASISGVLRWIKAVLGSFGIASANIRSFVLEQASPLSELLAEALSSDDEAVNHGLGRQNVEFSCDSVAVSALSAACASGSCLRQLITKLRAVAIAPGIHTIGVGVELLEEFVSCFGEREPESDISHSKLCASSTWIAVGRVLRWAVQHWQAIESVVEITRSAQSGPSLSTPSESLALSRADLQQSLAILQPVLDSLQSGLTTGHSQRDKCAGCPKAVVNAFAARLSTLNELEPLQLVHVDREGGTDDEGGAENENTTVVRPADVTGFARKLRHELATRWDVVIQEGVYQADNACLATFLHPCFRHLEFMDKARRATVLDEVKTLGRAAIISQRRKARPSISTPSSGRNSSSSSDHQEDDENDIEYSRVSKKRKTTTELAKLERLAHQAEELARLGLLKMAKSSPPLHEQSGDGTGTGLDDDAASGTSNAALTLSCSSPAFLIANELKRYLQNESIAFHAVAFDATLTYWDRKAFEFPILAAVAQAVSGAPRSLCAICHASSFPNRGGCCVHCCLRKCQHRILSSSNIGASSNDGRLMRRRLEEILHFLHLNEKFVPATTSIPWLSRESAVHVLEIIKSPSERVVDTASL